MAKSEPKTMRFETDVEAYINKAPGENFSERFHNLVYWIKDREAKQKAKIAQLDKEIAEKQKRLTDLNNMLFDVRHLERQFKELQTAIDGAKGYLEHFAEKDLKKVIQKQTPAPLGPRQNVLQDQDGNEYRRRLGNE